MRRGLLSQVAPSLRYRVLVPRRPRPGAKPARGENTVTTKTERDTDLENMAVLACAYRLRDNMNFTDIEKTAFDRSEKSPHYTTQLHQRACLLIIRTLLTGGLARADGSEWR